MLRRTILFGIAVSSLAAGPVLAAEATTKSATPSAASKSAASSQAQPEPVQTFTNADIDALPATDNAALPSLDADADAQDAANRFVIIGTPEPAGESTPPPVEADPATAAQSMQWVEQMLAERERAALIATAQRRVRNAEARVEEIERTYRPKGSAFPERRNTDRLFVRGVAGTAASYDQVLRDAYVDLAAARAALDELLAQTAARRTAATGGAS